jgi:aminopeptidase N
MQNSELGRWVSWIAVLLTAHVAAAQPGDGNAGPVESLARATGKADLPRTIDVLSYRLIVDLAMVTEELGGRNEITLVLIEPADSIMVHAYRLELDSAFVNGVRAQVIVYPDAEGAAIRLPSLHAAGDTLSVIVHYRRLPSVVRPTYRKGYYHFTESVGIPAPLGYTMSEPSDARAWMPCWDDPREKAAAEVHATVPDGFVAASNGRLLGTTPNGDGTTTWHWRESNPITTYLMCITASRFTISTLPYVRADADTIPLQYYVWAEDSVQCASYLPTVEEMVATLSRLFRPYPFDKYGMTAVTPFAFGGMEHQTLTTMHRALATDRTVVIHELAHQWFGNLVTCAAWPHIWLNESFATYSEALWEEQAEGPPDLQDYMTGNLERFYAGSWQGAIYDPEGQGFNLFSQSVYSKGAWVLHTLRGVVGDSLFFRILRTYLAAYAGSSVTTEDFQAIVESVAGTGMDWFFDPWVYGPGWPVYEFRPLWGSTPFAVTVFQRQDPTWPTYTMPIRLRAWFQGKDTTVVIIDSLREQTFVLGFSAPPDSIIFDPDRWILKQMATTTEVAGKRDLPASFDLEQNYPNPFNGETVIRYRVGAAPQRGGVRILVYDLTGREVALLVDGPRDPGEYTVSWNPAGLASGVYVVRLQGGGVTIARKMTLIR